MRVIVFALNGCPAGWLGAYGNDWVGTPNLDRLAAEAVTFDRHISDRPEPHPSALACSSRLTGIRTIFVRANHPDTDAPPSYYAGWGEVFDARPQPNDDSPLDELLRTFPALLDRLADVPGFLLWIETDRLIPPWDVQQDVFEAYLEDAEDAEPWEEAEAVEAEEDSPEEEGDSPEEENATDEEFVEDVDEEELEEPDEPEPATPEEPVPPFADPPIGPFDRSDLVAWEYLHRTFAAVVTKLDAELGHLFADLRSRGLDRSASWLITSDFGHPLGEHGQIGLHRPYLHEELVHLPLILRLPDAEQGGRRAAGFTQPPDLYPTLLALLGAPPPASANGFNLLPLARGEAAAVREFAVTQLELGGAAEIAIRTAEWALLVPTRVSEGDPPREPLLFEKPDDRWEVNDLRGRNIERADELEAKLREEIQKRG
jgi:arylsulfatase A-like enzyme